MKKASNSPATKSHPKLACSERSRRIEGNQQQPTILVTGANGQLGLTIKELFEVNGEGIEFKFCTKEELDITNENELKSFFSVNQVDYCINCAAYTNVEQAEKTPETAFKVNAEGVKNLAKICEEHGVTLIHISTDYVFDGEKRTPYLVDDIPNPINEYGKSKLLGEQYIQKYLADYYILRVSWLYSKTYGKNFYKFVLEQAKQGHDLSITTDQMGCPTNTEDLAKHIIESFIKRNSSYGVYHYCNSKPMTWYEFARGILKENKLLDRVNLKAVDSYKTIAQRPKYSVLG